MAYFPLFIDLEGKPVLIVGGGRMALDKAHKLMGYGARITVIAPEIRPELAEIPGLVLLRRPFGPGDIQVEYAFVIAATDDNDVNRLIAAQCRVRRIPVNVVDTQEECSFIFPSLVHRGPLSIGISTGGASPAAAVRIRSEIEAGLPASTEEILLWLASLRPWLRDRTSGEPERKQIYRALLEEALRMDRALNPEETEAIVTRFVSQR